MTLESKRMGGNVGLQTRSHLYQLLPRVQLRSYTRLIGDRAVSVGGLWTLWTLWTSQTSAMQYMIVCCPGRLGRKITRYNKPFEDVAKRASERRMVARPGVNRYPFNRIDLTDYLHDKIHEV